MDCAEHHLFYCIERNKFWSDLIIRDKLELMVAGTAIVGCDAIHWQSALLDVL